MCMAVIHWSIAFLTSWHLNAQLASQACQPLILTSLPQTPLSFHPSKHMVTNTKLSHRDGIHLVY